MQRILEPGELEKARGTIEECILPSSTLFADRAARCRQLVSGKSPLAPYLQFLAALGELQQKELIREENTDGRGGEFSPSSHFISLVKWLAKEMAVGTADDTQAVLASVTLKENSWILVQAAALLAGKFDQVSAATAPIIGAALQIEWAQKVLRQNKLPAPRHEESAICPICGGPPVAGVIDGSRDGLRYLHCAFCGAAWHMVRSKCSNCGENKEIEYFFSDEIAVYARAETCSSCQTYLKIFLTEKEPALDPHADDLATFALDLQLAEMGYARNGVNIFLLADKDPLS